MSEHKAQCHGCFSFFVVEVEGQRHCSEKCLVDDCMNQLAEEDAREAGQVYTHPTLKKG